MYTGFRILVVGLAALVALGVGATIVSGTPVDGDHTVSEAAKWIDDVAADRWSDHHRGANDDHHDGYERGDGYKHDGYERGDGYQHGPHHDAGDRHDDGDYHDDDYHHDDVRRGGGGHHGPHGR